MYPVQFVLAASVPLMAWASVFAFGRVQSSRGRLRMEVNVLAIIGALLGFVSFATGWNVSEHGGDWAAIYDYSLFLLFTYPVAVITPLAGIGQAGMLLWVMDFWRENNADLGSQGGYLLAWVSVAFMFAGMVWPQVPFGSGAKPTVGDRLLTLTLRRTSKPWASPEHSLAIVIAIFYATVGVMSALLHRGMEPFALLFLGALFVWFMILKRPHPSAPAEPSPPSTKEAENISAARSRHMAWILFVLASYAAVLAAMSLALGSLFASHHPRFGWEGNLFRDVAVLAVAVPVAWISRRRAVTPPLPRSLVLGSVIVFASLVLIASIQSTGIMRTGLTVLEYLVFACIALVGPALLLLDARGEGGHPEGKPV